MPEIPKRVKDITGQKFNQLLVLAFVDIAKGRFATWKCLCDCGTVVPRIFGTCLRNGHTKSCGCLKVEKITRHGLNRSRLYNIYSGIVDRCTNENSPSFSRYGGRGIYIHESWLRDKKMFFEWSFANGYSDNLTIDRIDNNGPYSPDNCRWTTVRQQSRNKHNTWMIEVDDQLVCAFDYLDSLSNVAVDYEIVRSRITRSGWSLEDAINKPKQRKN